MGLLELKERWATGGPWQTAGDEWIESREAALPELRSIVDRFQRGETSPSEFRHQMDSFSKKQRHWGFGGTSGQMFLNTLVKAADEESLARALRKALPAPADEGDCRQKFGEFLAFVDDVRDRARELGVTLPSLGYAPYFLSFFWEAQVRETWPIYYPASRDTLARHGLFVDTGPLAERYLSYRELIFRLRSELNSDTWGVEALLWHLEQETKEKPKPKNGSDGAVPKPDDLYESYRSQDLIFPDEVITSLVLSLLTKPFVLLSGISGTGKTQIAVGLAEYLERRGSELVEAELPEGDDSSLYIRLTEARLRLGRSNLIREHQAVFALHGGLPERGSFTDYVTRLPDGATAEMRLNNIGFSDRARELYLLFFRGGTKEWLEANAKPDDFLRLVFQEDGKVSAKIVRPERRVADVPARRHEVIAVKSDWTDPRGLIGYENPLTGSYSKTDLINILLRAQADPDNPYVVILDEMNLARVEYYFSDFLSATELSDGNITLRSSREDGGLDEEVEDEVPAKLVLPPNVLFIGTVNIDETTFTFSPKVLDRANVLVFNDVDVQRFLEGGGEAAAATFRLKSGALDPAELANRASAGAVALGRAKEFAPFSEVLSDLFSLLESHNRHFGYRVLMEITTFVGHALERVEGDEEDVARTAFDLQLLQKVLPKLSGGRELEALLTQLLVFCLDPAARRDVDASAALEEGRRRLGAQSAEPAQESGIPSEPNEDLEEAAVVQPGSVAVVYPRAARALERMLTRLQQTGFVAFLE